MYLYDASPYAARVAAEGNLPDTRQIHEFRLSRAALSESSELKRRRVRESVGNGFNSRHVPDYHRDSPLGKYGATLSE